MIGNKENENDKMNRTADIQENDTTIEIHSTVDNDNDKDTDTRSTKEKTYGHLRPYNDMKPDKK